MKTGQDCLDRPYVCTEARKGDEREDLDFEFDEEMADIPAAKCNK